VGSKGRDATIGGRLYSHPLKRLKGSKPGTLLAYAPPIGWRGSDVSCAAIVVKGKRAITVALMGDLQLFRKSRQGRAMAVE